MAFTWVVISSRGGAYQLMPPAPVAGPGWWAPRTDLFIHDQVDRVLANKQIRDIRVNGGAARRCGCPHCRQAYRLTLAFYAGPGRKPPTREGVTTRVVTRYTRRGGASPSERQQKARIICLFLSGIRADRPHSRACTGSTGTMRIRWSERCSDTLWSHLMDQP
jgi:hypothetical protein